MAGETSGTGRGLLSGIRSGFGFAVAIAVALAWLVTWATSDLAMGLLGSGGAIRSGSVEAATFFVIMVVMMIAMMLPSALPMILAFHGISRLEAGRPSKPADLLGTAIFVGAYFLVWGAFAVVALYGLGALGLVGPLMGAIVLVPAIVLLAAGAYQVTRAKEVCLTHCQSPMMFVMSHWRSGRRGALRMGLHHAMYCLGCCWLFMLVLFVAGSMSLLWMGLVSVAIFAEKVGTRGVRLSRGIGALFIALGSILVARALVPF